MLSFKIFVCVTWLAVLGVEYSEACGRPTYRPYIRPDGHGGIEGGVRAEWKFSKHNPNKRQCEGVNKAMIRREDWKAVAPRHQVSTDGVAKKVFIWQTGSNVCHLVDLTGNRCQNCLQDSTCLPSVIFALQDEDLRNGKDDIRYNFLIGQDGVIYEGRGWGVVGKHTSVDVAMVGDFNNKEPNQASQDALNKLLLCGKSSGQLTSDVQLSSSPKMAGQAFYASLQRCNGPCV